MEPIKLTCPQCGAPVPTVPGATNHTCQFCKMTFAFNASGASPDDEEDWDDEDGDDDEDYDDEYYEEHHHHHYHQQSRHRGRGWPPGRAVARPDVDGSMGIIALTSLAGERGTRPGITSSTPRAGTGRSPTSARAWSRCSSRT
ncbi:MAG: hypothetical protein U0235_33320 [Polyangiaceae bacterium]